MTAITKGMTTGKAMSKPMLAKTSKIQRNQYCMDLFAILSPIVQTD